MIDSTKYLLEKEVVQVEAMIKAIRPTNLRDSLLIETTLRTGARASEVLELTKSSFMVLEDDDGEIAYALKVITLKQRSKKVPTRLIVVKAEFWMRLKTYSESLPSDHLFPISYKRMQQIWNWHNPLTIKKSLHALRHSAAKSVYKRTTDLQAVKNFLGHSSISSTMVYAEIDHTLKQQKAYAV